jgi:ribosomal-protein-alanine N-acetyltransferase
VNDLSLPIRCERVLIRCLEERDFEDLYALDIDPDVKRYVGGPVQRPRVECISLMRAKLGAETCPLAIVLNEDASFVGRALLAKTRLTTISQPLWKIEWEIQVLIARKYWCKGFGREVASELIGVAFALSEVTSVVAIVHPENAASRKLMDNLGFRYDGQNSSQTWDPVGGKYVREWDHEHMIFRLARPYE